jgi:hypothetical protein
LRQQLIQPGLINLIVNPAGNAKADLELAPDLIIRDVEYMFPGPGALVRVVMAHFGLPINPEYGVPSRATEPTAVLPGWLRSEVARLFQEGIKAKLERHQAKALRRANRSQPSGKTHNSAGSLSVPSSTEIDGEDG